MLMKLNLTPSYYLTDEGVISPRVVHRPSGTDYGPDDVVEWYRSWGPQPCRHSVRRAAATMSLLDPDQAALVARFIGPGRPTTEAAPAVGHIHLRVTMDRKSRYVRAAKRRGQPLSEWMQAACDSACEPPQTPSQHAPTAGQ